MPIIDTITAELPETVENAPGKTYTKEIVRAGFSIDGRTLTNDEINSLYNNTKTNFLEKGILLKVKVGHFQGSGFFGDNDQELKGFATNLELRKADAEEEHRLSIWSKIHLYPEIATAYEEGRYPEVSIGNFGKIRDNDGNDIEDIIDHIALLGADRAALPFLRSALDQLGRLYNSIRKTQNMEVNHSMNEINLANFKEALAAIELTARQALSLISENKQDTKEEPPKEEPEVIDNGPSMETLKSFQSLVSNGNISPDKEEKFYSLVEKAGLEYAIAHYSDESAKKPDTDNEEITSNRDEKKLKKQTKALLDIATRMGYTDPEKAKEIVEGGVE